MSRPQQMYGINLMNRLNCNVHVSNTDEIVEDLFMMIEIRI